MSASHRYKSTSEPRVSVLVVQQLVAAVERAGVCRRQFLDAIQLDSEVLDQADARLPMADMFRYCEVALDVTGDPALGLHWAEWLTVRSFNIVTQLLVHASSLRHAFEMLFQFGELIADDIGLVLIERDDIVELHCGGLPIASPRVRRTTAEMSALGMFRVLREFDGPGQIRRVAFAYTAPSYREAYARAFDGLECFEQPFTGLIFDRVMLDAVTRGSDASLQSTLRELAERRISAVRQEATLALRVRDLLTEQHAPQRVALKNVAQWLHVSKRSLTRRLADEGRPYRALAHEAAAIVARRLLVDEQHTVKETAFRMGFSEAPAFNRAFKRWTGTTPAKFRAR